MPARKLMLLQLVLVVSMHAFASAATIDVTRFDDPPGPCDPSGCSLRQALLQANAVAGPDVVTLHAGTYKLKLKGDDATAAAGDLDVTEAVEIDGDAAGGTIINASGGKDRAFEVLDGGALTLGHVTVKGGSAVGDGGGVLSVGTLTIHDSVVTGNKASESGGGIASEAGTCTLTNVVVTKNKALGNDGGGLEFFPAGSATVVRSTISKNAAADTGGAMDSDNGVTVSFTDCTISGNKSKREGGGLDPSIGTVTVTNTTISGNRSAKGGGIQLEDGGALVLDHVTLTRNSAKEGGGLWTEPGTTATLTATILAANSKLDCFGPIVSGGSNLIGTVEGCFIGGDPSGNVTGGPKPLKPVKPGLAGLKDNGGPTKTHALIDGSPALDAVVAGCPPPATDQRGLARSAPCDIGAFERQ